MVNAENDEIGRKENRTLTYANGHRITTTYFIFTGQSDSGLADGTAVELEKYALKVASELAETVVSKPTNCVFGLGAS